MRFILLTILFFPSIALASIAGEVTVGDRVVAHDSFYIEPNGAQSFYQDGVLVITTHDLDQNDVLDLWLVYESDQVVYEGHDTDGNGEPDLFITLGDNEVITEQTGTKVPAWKRPDIVEFSDLIITTENEEKDASSDLVGSLDRITIPHGGLPWVTIVLWLGVFGAGFWWYKKRN